MWRIFRAVAKQNKHKPQLSVPVPIDEYAAPIATAQTPNSILADPSTYTIRYFNGRGRYATCGSVAWFHGEYIATVSLLGRALNTYHFDKENGTLTLFQSLRHLPSLAGPECAATSPDGRLLAVADMTKGTVTIFAINQETHLVDVQPLTVIHHPNDSKAHGVCFSPCSRFLAYTTIDSRNFVRLYRIERNQENVHAEPFQNVENKQRWLVPKGVDFSPNGRYIAVCYGPNASATRKQRTGGSLHMYAFDDEHGIDLKSRSVGSKQLALVGPDDVKFFRCGSHVILMEQGTDEGAVVEVDQETGAVGQRVAALTNEYSQLSFPHGAGFTDCGTYLAIANYGNDSVSIFKTQQAA